MSDAFSNQKTSLNSPANHAFAITPADSADIAQVTRGLYVGGAGNVKVDMAGGETVTFTGLAVGVVHALRVKRVYQTGTTATSILGLY
ncbi:MAG: hypothetical protein WBV94_25210 [Blastocatellia bacterium]